MEIARRPHDEAKHSPLKANVQRSTFNFQLSDNVVLSRFRGRLFREDPDVAVNDRIAVILQLDRARFGAFRAPGRSRGFADLDTLVNEDAVVLDGERCVPRFLSGVVVLCGLEIDVVSLPGERRKTHVHPWPGDRINAAALVVFSGEPERIEHLYLEPVLKINATVSAGLAACLWHERSAELH